MSERYSKLFTLSENLYATGSPVVIAAGALLKDTQTGKVLAQLKLRNIGKKTIKAATVFVEPLDTVGKPLGAPVTYQYLDLHADRDADFGQKTPIALPDSATRSFAVSVVQVIFTDNSIWNDDSPAWKPLSRPKPLDALGDSELAKQFRIEYGGGCENLLLEQKDLWHCVCGAVNRQEETNCHKCHKILAELQAIDMEGLRKNKEERVAKERAEAETARIKAKQDAEIAAAKAKKIGKIAAIVAPILLIAIVAATIISGMVKKSNAYDNALALLEYGQYDEAIQAFSLLGDYKDSTERIQTANNEKMYNQAIAVLESGDFENAILAFSDLGDYRDSPQKLDEAQLEKKYQQAIALLESERTQERAYNIFLELGNYKESQNYIEDFLYLLVKVVTDPNSKSGTTTYSYDSHGRISETVCGNDYYYYTYFSNGTYMYKYAHKSTKGINVLWSNYFNEHGDLIASENGTEKSQYQWVYSEDGSEKTKKYTFMGNDVSVTYPIDQHNNILSEVNRTYEYSYNEDELIIRKVEYEDSSLSKIWEFDYDEYGNKIKITLTYGDGKSNITTYENTYAYRYCPDVA